MILERTDHFKRCFKKLPSDLQALVEDKLTLLVSNPRHPSLRVKKMKGREDIWEASVTMAYRLTFHWIGRTILLRKVGTHDRVLKHP